jgi:hypothetical protein
MGIQLINNVLSQILIDKIFSYAQTQTKVVTNHTLWPSDVVDVSGPIYLINLPSELREEIRCELHPYLESAEIKNSLVDINYTLGGRYSYIPWHDDFIHGFSVTIYLNEVWSNDWGGCFLYEDGDDIKAIYPKYNTAILFKPPLMHCTVMPTINAPLRKSLQIFFKK